MQGAQTKIAGAILMTGLIIGGPAWADTPAPVTYKGQVVSHDVRVIDGRPYVPLADVAKILGGSVAKGDGGYTIEAAGGANQINGLQGKVGQMLFGGKWRFEVVSFTRVPTFTTQYSATSTTVSPTGANDELVVASCLVKNGEKSEEQIIMREYGAAHSALTDDQEVSYPCIDWDYGGGSSYGPTLLPGSAQHFNLVFSVPKATNLKDLVEGVAAFGDNGGDTFRVSMSQ